MTFRLKSQILLGWVGDLGNNKIIYIRILWKKDQACTIKLSSVFQKAVIGEMKSCRRTIYVSLEWHRMICVLQPLGKYPLGLFSCFWFGLHLNIQDSTEEIRSVTRKARWVLQMNIKGFTRPIMKMKRMVQWKKRKEWSKWTKPRN